MGLSGHGVLPFSSRTSGGGGGEGALGSWEEGERNRNREEGPKVWGQSLSLTSFFDL